VQYSHRDTELAFERLDIVFLLQLRFPISSQIQKPTQIRRPVPKKRKKTLPAVASSTDTKSTNVTVSPPFSLHQSFPLVLEKQSTRAAKTESICSFEDEPFKEEEESAWHEYQGVGLTERNVLLEPPHGTGSTDSERDDDYTRMKSQDFADDAKHRAEAHPGFDIWNDDTV
jgi:hypothetical protein